VVRATLAQLAAKGQFDDLRTLVDTHCKRSPEDTETALQGAGLLAVSSRHLKDSLTVFEEVAKTTAYPLSVKAKLGAATVAYQLGRTAKAKRYYRDVLARDSRNAQALNDLAWILQERDGEYREALELADRGIRESPTNVHLLDTRAVIYCKLKRPADARRDFEMLAKRTTDSGRKARALVQLGEVCLELRDTRSAKVHLADAKKIDAESKVLTDKQRGKLSILLAKCRDADD
jgi:tetratricopeptide (TPR) repeat protein